MKDKFKKGSLLKLVWILLLIMTLTTGVLARFTSRSQSADLARVAKFVFDTSLHEASASASFDTLKGKIQKPGDMAEFALQVTNQKDGTVSEVSESYEIKIDLDGSMPLTCRLLQQGETRMVWSNLPSTPSGPNSGAAYPSLLKAGEAGTHDYILQVCWPAEEDGRRYANGSAAGEITVTFTAAQAD